MKDIIKRCPHCHVHNFIVVPDEQEKLDDLFFICAACNNTYQYTDKEDKSL